MQRSTVANRRDINDAINIIYLMNRVNLHLKMITSLSELIVENIIYKRSKRDVCCAASSVLASKLARSAPVGQCRAPPEPSCNDNKKNLHNFFVYARVSGGNKRFPWDKEIVVQAETRAFACTRYAYGCYEPRYQQTCLRVALLRV